MAAILEHFKPPPLASDPPEKTRFWPAPPTGSSGGILQRPKPVSMISTSSSSSQLSAPSNPVTPSSPTTSTRVSFAPLPKLVERKRRNSITLGVAARSAALRKMKERSTGPPPADQRSPAAGPRPPIPRSHGSTGSAGRRNAQYTYQHYQAGQPRPRRPGSRAEFKDDQVVDLGEVAMDAGKKLWRVINKKTRKPSAASDSGRPVGLGEERSVGGPTVGASGHNTEREILVRGFAVPEKVPDEDEDEDEGDEERYQEAAEEQAHRTEDYVADMQALHVHDESSVSFPVDLGAVSPTHSKVADSLQPGHLHSTQYSPPPLTPESDTSDLFSTDGSALSRVTTPNQESQSIDGPVRGYLESSPQKDSLF